MKTNILLITKDAFSKEYLPHYGNTYWKGKTPNIDELVKKGTIFTHYYASAPSTVMSFRGMMFGKFAHETPYHNYTPQEIPSTSQDFFEIAKSKGYKGHIIWDSAWVKMVLRYGNCYGNKTTIHNLENIRQGVGAHYNHNGTLQRDDKKTDEAIKKIENEVVSILNEGNQAFVWLHLPHVINGRTGYGDDIDVFDTIVGTMRKYFSDDCIFISADHGNMNGFKGKYCYGFDVYTQNIEIPLITPRLGEIEVCDDFVSNIDIKQIIFEGVIPKRDFIYSDTQYYAQPNRKLAIIHDGFLYIYSKKTKKEELYDLMYDPQLRCNMISDTFYDVDRELETFTRELFFSPRWEEAQRIRTVFKNERKRIWKEPPLLEAFKESSWMLAKKKAVKILKTVKK